MLPKKLLVLSVSAGSGHTRAANAICAYADENLAAVETTHWDVMDYVTVGLRKVYTDFYIEMVNRAPTLWGYLYNYTHEAKSSGVIERLRRRIEGLNARQLRKKIEEFKPDAIICTHFLPAEILAQLIKKDLLDCPVWVQVTDFDLHRMWVHQGMAGYFVANAEIAFRLQTQGISSNEIHVTGIPIMPAFAKEHSRESYSAAFGFDPQKVTFLMMSGGSGIGKLARVAKQLMRVDHDFQLIVVAGKNAEALSALQSLQTQYPHRLFPYGFTDQVEQLMACSDLVISKPGGLTTAECLAMGLPMIVSAPIPGQEERNANYLLESGAALQAFDGVTLEYRIRHLLAQPEKLVQMRAHAIAMARPFAAAQVLAKVLA